jgi:hypothetical protein
MAAEADVSLLHRQATAQRLWKEGFNTARQPSFRFNRLRTAKGAGLQSASALKVASLPSRTSRRSNAKDVEQSTLHATHPSLSRQPRPPALSPTAAPFALCATQAIEDGAVQQLLAGVGLPADTKLEPVPFFPRAVLLPASTAQAVNVPYARDTVAPLRVGAHRHHHIGSPYTIFIYHIPYIFYMYTIGSPLRVGAHRHHHIGSSRALCTRMPHHTCATSQPCTSRPMRPRWCRAGGPGVLPEHRQYAPRAGACVSAVARGPLTARKGAAADTLSQPQPRSSLSCLSQQWLCRARPEARRRGHGRRRGSEAVACPGHVLGAWRQDVAAR